MKNIKKYTDFVKESLSYKKEIDEDGDDIIIKAILNGKELGHVHIKYIFGNGYQYDFEPEMTEERYDELFPDDRYAKILEISVNNGFIGKGYAKQLMYKAIEEIKSKGENRIYLNVCPIGNRCMGISGLVEFYKKFGFKIIIDDYSENKEMLLVLENSSPTAGPNQTLKTIDAYLRMYDDETKKKENEREEKRKDTKKERADVIIGEFDEDTPDFKSDLETQQPSMNKNVSLAYGSTNMP